jgi:hypothetical protein
MREDKSFIKKLGAQANEHSKINLKYKAINLIF